MFSLWSFIRLKKIPFNFYVQRISSNSIRKDIRSFCVSVLASLSLSLTHIHRTSLLKTNFLRDSNIQTHKNKCTFSNYSVFYYLPGNCSPMENDVIHQLLVPFLLSALEAFIIGPRGCPGEWSPELNRVFLNGNSWLHIQGPLKGFTHILSQRLVLFQVFVWKEERELFYFLLVIRRKNLFAFRVIGSRLEHRWLMFFLLSKFEVFG